jgi:hypothetical protein
MEEEIPADGFEYQPTDLEFGTDDNQIFIDPNPDGLNGTHSHVDFGAEEDININPSTNSSTLDLVYNFPVVHPSLHPSSDATKPFDLDAGIPTSFCFQIVLSHMCTHHQTD